MDPSARKLIEILEYARELLARTDNDFAWQTYWKSPDEAKRELGILIAKIRESQPAPMQDYEYIFAPAGPMQEISLSSGWSHEYFKLCGRADEAIEQYFLRVARGGRGA